MAACFLSRLGDQVNQARERTTTLDLTHPWEHPAFWFFAHTVLPPGISFSLRGDGPDQPPCNTVLLPITAFWGQKAVIRPGITAFCPQNAVSWQRGSGVGSGWWLAALLGRVVRAAAADITPLRESAAFRRLFAGHAVSLIGTQVTRVAVPLQVYAITRSSLDVGLIELASFVPLVVFGLYGGSIADAVDRRKLVLVISTGTRQDCRHWPGVGVSRWIRPLPVSFRGSCCDLQKL